MKLYDKVVLTEDYTDQQGLKFTKGQTGVIAIGKEVDDGYWAVEFNGYSDLKEKERVLKETRGEGANIVPWVGLIPAKLISVMES